MISSPLFGVPLWEFTTTVMVTRWSPLLMPAVKASVTAAVATVAEVVLSSGATQRRLCTLASCSDGVTDGGRRPRCFPPRWPRIPLRDGSNCCSTCCMQRRPQRLLHCHRPSSRSWPPRLQLLQLQRRQRRRRCHCYRHQRLHRRHQNDCLGGVVTGVGDASARGASAGGVGAVAGRRPLPRVCL